MWDKNHARRKENDAFFHLLLFIILSFFSVCECVACCWVPSFKCHSQKCIWKIQVFQIHWNSAVSILVKESSTNQFWIYRLITRLVNSVWFVGIIFIFFFLKRFTGNNCCRSKTIKDNSRTKKNHSHAYIAEFA